MSDQIPKKKRIIPTFLMYLSAILVLFVLILGCLLLWEKSGVFEKESSNIRKEYISSQKQMLQHEVGETITYIQYMKSQTEKRIRQDVKSRTEEAFQIANHIYQIHRKTKSLDDIKQLVHDALFAASWDDGSGYYFAEDIQGTVVINRNNPELEGTNVLDFQDSKGKFIMQDILHVVKESGEGFTSYYWNKPDEPEVLVPKISYVKYFKPLDWIIGNGKYLDDEEKKVKSEVLEILTQIQFGDGNYIFAGTWDGVSLTGPFSGKNMLHLKDSNGVEIVKRLIQAAKSGGDFVDYVMPKHKGVRPVPKISYAEGIADWRWYVGAGVYVDAIEMTISQRQIDFRSQIQGYFGRALGVLLVFFLVALCMAWWMSSKMKEHLNIFGNFFKDAAEKAVTIDVNRLNYVEFQALAESANEMILLRQRALSELEASEKQFVQMVELAPVPILISNKEGQVEFINNQFKKNIWI
jgi:two-component system cell cycle sensor histidine kinase/response regulator CckA